MKAPSPAFSVYPKDILSDESCSLMTHEQFGCYMRLLMHSWLEGSIPADPTRLARLLGINAAKFGAVWPAIAPCWEPSADEPGRLVQGRQERQRAKQEAFAASQAAKGARGGKSKAANKTPKPVLDPGQPPATAESKPEPSLPFPIPIPSNEVGKEEDARVKAPPVATHPLIPDPAVAVTEGNALITAIAKRDDLCPIDVVTRATAWKGQGLTRLPDDKLDRLAHALRTLRAWAATGQTPEQQAAARAASGPRPAVATGNWDTPDVSEAARRYAQEVGPPPDEVSDEDLARARERLRLIREGAGAA